MKKCLLIYYFETIDDVETKATTYYLFRKTRSKLG